MRPTVRLLTFPISHFCEKARWALDLAGIAYVEEPHLPLAHRVYTGRAGGRSVPVLLTRERALTDSGQILRWADANARAATLFPTAAGPRQEAYEMERWLDREIGVQVRRWAYSELLPAFDTLRECFTAGVPAVERALAPLLLPAARAGIRKGYGVTAENAARSLERVREAFRRLDDKLADGRPYLVGEGFGAADLTFASLAAPALAPERYGGRFPPFDALPATMRAEIERFRATRAGRHALEMYARHR